MQWYPRQAARIQLGAKRPGIGSRPSILSSEAVASFAFMDTFCICELCREKVDPDDPEVVRAVEMIEIVSLGPTYERIPGLTVYFHREHYPSHSADYQAAA